MAANLSAVPPAIAAQRGHAYTLLLCISCAVAASRVLSAPGPIGTNDVSRWLTVRALLESGDYAIGRRIVHTNGRIEDVGLFTEPGWHTVDRVLHPATRRFYSSKPPLLPTLVAGECWLLGRLFGWTLSGAGQLALVRAVLITFNWLPLVLSLVLLVRMIDRLGVTGFGRLFTAATACLGTFLITFAMALNNHTVAACATVFALHPFVRITVDDRRAWWRFAAVGFFAAFAACVDLPAAALLLTLTIALLQRSPRSTVAWLLPAAIIPVTAFFLTNYLAIGRLVPAYASMHSDWYHFDGSYWNDPVGNDVGERARAVYAFRFLFGAQGAFTLSPVFLLSLAGMALGLPKGARDRPLQLVALVCTIVVVAFYLLATNNYGGRSSGPRWLFWLIPLWVLALVRAADASSRDRRLRCVCYILFAISTMSAIYPTNPWQMPWTYRLFGGISEPTRMGSTTVTNNTSLLGGGEGRPSWLSTKPPKRPQPVERGTPKSLAT